MNSTRLAALLLAAAIAGAGPIYTVVDLGSLGGASAAAFAVSSNGLAAGAATTAFGYDHAFTSSGAGIVDLTLNTGASEGMAAAIDAAGQVAGTQYINGQAFATLWIGATVESIAGAGSYATAMNDAGEVAGMFTVDGQGHAFVRSASGVITDLGDLPGGAWSSAYGMNNQGQVAGYGDVGSGSGSGSGMFGAFVWTPGSGYTLLGTLGGANSYAMAINDGGEAAGAAQLASGYLHAFIAAPNGALEDLGTLGGNSSYAYGINDGGQVVGYSYTDSSGVTHAFLYENGVMIDLNDLIDPSSGWTLTAAYAINGGGEIVGSGILDGVEHAFLLEPSPASSDAGISPESTGASVPEPSTWTLVLIAGSTMFLTRLHLRRRRPVRQPAPPRSSVWLP